MCDCGAETDITDNPIGFGEVFECPSCLVVVAKIYPQGGGREWVKIPLESVKFHRLTRRYQHKD